MFCSVKVCLEIVSVLLPTPMCLFRATGQWSHQLISIWLILPSNNSMSGLVCIHFAWFLKTLINSQSPFLINIQFEYFVLNAESNPQNCTTNRPQRHKWLLLLFCGLAIVLRFTSFTFERREKYSIQFIFHLSNFNAMWSLL